MVKGSGKVIWSCISRIEASQFLLDSSSSLACFIHNFSLLGMTTIVYSFEWDWIYGCPLLNRYRIMYPDSLNGRRIPCLRSQGLSSKPWGWNPLRQAPPKAVHHGSCRLPTSPPSLLLSSASAAQSAPSLFRRHPCPKQTQQGSPPRSFKFLGNLMVAFVLGRNMCWTVSYSSEDKGGG